MAIDSVTASTRERVPLDWAATQGNLGNALRMLGRRQSGTARLEEAVAAYRATLEELTREAVPQHDITQQIMIECLEHMAECLALLEQRRIP